MNSFLQIATTWLTLHRVTLVDADDDDPRVSDKHVKVYHRPLERYFFYTFPFQVISYFGITDSTWQQLWDENIYKLCFVICMNWFLQPFDM